MTHPNTPTRKILPISILGELVTLTHSHPVSGWDFEKWHYKNFASLIQATNSDFVQFINTIKKELLLRGFVVLGLSQLLNDLAENEAAGATTMLLSCLGTPLKVFLDRSHWRRLEVDLKRPLASSGGIGDQPFHMDFVNAENPPDLVCLLCVRSDPLGGGASPISFLDGLEKELDPVHLEILSRPLYRDGEVRNLNGVGHDINPFPVLAPGTRWAYRYTEKLINSTLSDEARGALQVVSNILISRKLIFMLSHGDLLILDQHRVTHGRQALGQKQDKITKDMRRLLLQSFIRVEVAL